VSPQLLGSRYELDQAPLEPGEMCRRSGVPVLSSWTEFCPCALEVNSEMSQLFTWMSTLVLICAVERNENTIDPGVRRDQSRFLLIIKRTLVSLRISKRFRCRISTLGGVEMENCF